MTKRLLVIAAAVITMAVASTTVASAKRSTVLATPSAACRILVQYGAVSDTTFGGCMTHINADIAAYRFPDDVTGQPISLLQRCQGFESEGMTYPFTFEEGPEWPFPVLTAQNRRQCATTLYTYHTLAGA